MHRPDFESGVVKVPLGEQSALGRSKHLVLSGTDRNCSPLLYVDGYKLSFTKQSLKRQRLRSNFHGTNYEHKRFLFPTSYICGHLFLKACFTLTERGALANPEKIEAQICLWMNEDM